MIHVLDVTILSMRLVYGCKKINGIRFFDWGFGISDLGFVKGSFSYFYRAISYEVEGGKLEV